jgi:hypothetical protein
MFLMTSARRLIIASVGAMANLLTIVSNPEQENSDKKAYLPTPSKQSMWWSTLFVSNAWMMKVKQR